MVKFIDEAKIYIQSGAGGNGCMSFRREKHVPRGGPSGGDGGDGGDVTVSASGQVSSLLDCRYQRHYRAKRGAHGEGSGKHGASGDSLVISVPVGTVVRNSETREILADLRHDGESVIAARGGRGGRGNLRFTTSTNQAPRRADDGQPGENFEIFLELKLLADVGITGFPNAGKSTLISKVSAARPKIADYPFTTLVPSLGVVRWGDHKTFTMADIPGIIEGAHKGTGLGIRFLKHVERTKILVHMIDMSPVEKREPLEDYEKINSELRLYNEELAAKPQIVALNKTDIPEACERAEQITRILAEKGIEAVTISAVTGEGTQTLVNKIGILLEEIGEGKAE
ncbi:MAG: GTPase ObgE [Candidatus Mycalebacterium zealandia]|nr:MAG: GTPase ObgE [Candidatus Mycalebacterium zealandia]